VEFEILANYNPLPPGESYASQKSVKKDMDTDVAEPRNWVTRGGSAGGGRQGAARRPAPAVPRKAGAR